MNIVSKFNPAAVQTWLIANGLKIVIAGLLLIGAYAKGRMDVNSNLADKQAKVYERELAVQVREQKIEVKEQQAATERETTNNAELSSALGALNGAINKRTSNPTCDLTADELREFQRLVETTQ